MSQSLGVQNNSEILMNKKVQDIIKNAVKNNDSAIDLSHNEIEELPPEIWKLKNIKTRYHGSNIRVPAFLDGKTGGYK